MRSTLLAAVGLCLVMLTPHVVAVHGEAYDAYGIATLGDEVFTVHVAWTGYNFNTPCGQCFVVEITDGQSVRVVDTSFPGVWSGNGPVFYFFEVLAYNAQASAAAGGAAHFSISGVQAQQVAGGAPQKAIMLYQGNYDAYKLLLAVPYGIVL